MRRRLEGRPDTWFVAVVVVVGLGLELEVLDKPLPFLLTQGASTLSGVASKIQCVHLSSRTEHEEGRKVCHFWAVSVRIFKSVFRFALNETQ